MLAVPLLVHARPVTGSDVTAAELLDRVRQSRTVPFTGYAETAGAVSLPAEESLSSVARILGDTSSVRIWWSGPDSWRTATLRPTGETGHWHREGRMVRWVYESKRVTISPDVPVRLPISVDVLPHVLADRVLAGARPEELSRIGVARVAGRDTDGLRLTPSAPQSSIDHVDVWVDRGTGVPLEVEVVGDGEVGVALSTSMLDVSFAAPTREELAFTPPPDATLHFDEALDLAAAADRYADRTVPDALAGLPARAEGVRSVGVYGRGPTLLLAVPLRDSDAERLRDELAERPGAVCVPEGWVVTTGPLQLMVTAPASAGSWLVSGTVTQEAAVTAAGELVTGLLVEACP